MPSFVETLTCLSRSTTRIARSSRCSPPSRATITDTTACGSGWTTVYDSEVELISDPRLIALGFERVYRGREERIRFQERWTAEWGDFQFAPEELVDLGDGRLFASGRIVGSGLSSGAGFDGDWACVWTVSAGRMIREQFFLDRSDALEAAGLRE